MKVEFDGREKLSKNDRESIFAALDSPAATEGELQEVKVKLRAGQEKLKLMEGELEKNKKTPKASYAVVKCLKVEKFELCVKMPIGTRCLPRCELVSRDGRLDFRTVLSSRSHLGSILILMASLRTLVTWGSNS